MCSTVVTLGGAIGRQLGAIGAGDWGALWTAGSGISGANNTG